MYFQKKLCVGKCRAVEGGGGGRWRREVAEGGCGGRWREVKEEAPSIYYKDYILYILLFI